MAAVTINVHPSIFSVSPSVVTLVGPEPLTVVVDWTAAAGVFTNVTVLGFRDMEGRVIYAVPAALSFNVGNQGPENVRFSSVTVETYCKYDVVYEYANGDTITMDPVIIFKPR